MTRDYKRNGTTTLFAVLNVLDGQVIGPCQQRHAHAEWLKFPRKIDRATPKGKTLHLIADNYATHKHPEVQKWLSRHRICARYLRLPDLDAWKCRLLARQLTRPHAPPDSRARTGDTLEHPCEMALIREPASKCYFGQR